MKLQIFSGTYHPELSKKISKVMGVSLSPIDIKKFKDSETYVKVLSKVRGDDVFVIQPLSKPVNESLMELLIILDAMKRASAGRISVVIPYFGYARQDRKSTAREPITAKLVANLLTRAGADRVVTVDLHADQIQGFFDIPVDHFPCYPLFCEYYHKKKLKAIVAVAPDTGSAKKVRRFAKLMNIPLAIIDKRRSKHNQVEAVNVVGDVKGKHAIILDDLIDTGGTITSGAKAVMDKGARDVRICATHGVLSDPAMERIKNSAIKEVVLTDSLPIPKQKQYNKLKIITIAPLMAQVIERIHENKSLGELFTWEEIVQ